VHHFVPKVDGGERKIAYSGIRDRLVQAVLHDILTPAIDTRLTNSAFAYRQGISTHDAIRQIHSCVTGGQPFFVKSDFVQFFDRLDHTRLKGLIDYLDVDPRARQLVWRYARTGDVARNANTEARVYPPSRTLGVPQGGVISGLLANLYLCEFDEAVRTVAGATLVRYADDFLVLCRDKSVCAEASRAVVERAQAIQLELHEGPKTVTCGHMNDGVNFVGFRLRGTKVAVKPSNIAKFKKRMESVIALHETRFRQGEYSSATECLRQTIRHANLKLTGVEVEGRPRSWLVCFRILNDVEQVRQLDRWVWKRIAGLSRRIGLPYQTRTAVFGVGYRGLLRAYWNSRRRVKTFELPFSGMIEVGLGATADPPSA